MLSKARVRIAMFYACSYNKRKQPHAGLFQSGDYCFRDHLKGGGLIKSLQYFISIQKFCLSVYSVKASRRSFSKANKSIIFSIVGVLSW